MILRDLLKLIRSRWLTVVAVAAAVTALAILYSETKTPLYQASTRLFVSTTASSNLSEQYNGNRLSQERVLSYVELIKGQTLAQRTVDKLDLDMTAAQLRARVEASSKIDTVLIKVSVMDESPVRARDIANVLSDEFVVMVRELETPNPGARPDARVVVEERASVPVSPVVPKKVRNVALGLMLGLALGFAVALLRDQLDNTVKDRETLEEVTGLALLGAIPVAKELRDNPAIPFEKGSSGVAEAFRKLRTNLQFVAVDNPPRVILVTSSAPSEGKSTTAINVALALAEAGNQVVIVDGDMRRPAIDSYLDLVGSIGFSTVLSGAASLSEVLQQTKFPNLKVLAAGPKPPNPSELLGSQAAKKVLDELRAEFDYVVVDSSPLLAVTDGAILATHSDGALVVARHGHTKREQLAHAVKVLRDVGAPLLGAVFTITPTRGVDSYGYGYGYGYGKGYGQEVDQEASAGSDHEERRAYGGQDFEPSDTADSGARTAPESTR